MKLNFLFSTGGVTILSIPQSTHIETNDSFSVMLSINHESMFHEANGFFAEGFYTDDMKFQPRDKTYKYNSSPLIVIKHMNY